MIVVLKQNPNRDQLESLIAWLQEKGIIIHTSIGEANTILGLVGDTSKIAPTIIHIISIIRLIPCSAFPSLVGCLFVERTMCFFILPPHQCSCIAAIRRSVPHVQTTSYIWYYISDVSFVTRVSRSFILIRFHFPPYKQA